MTRKLHTKTKIFFENPYVVQVDHEGEWNYGHIEPASFKELKSRTYKLINGTWGFSPISVEMIRIFDTQDPLSLLFSSNQITRSYWCFKNEIDALQFRLMTGNNSRQVTMWPDRFFTIHEVVESDES